MNHVHEDQLLLLAYGELPETDARAVETHLATCVACTAQLERLTRARVALEVATGPAGRRRVSVAGWTLAGLAVAAGLAFVILRARPDSPTPSAGLSIAVPRYLVPDLAPIDSVLTRLEQEKPYAIP